jgi:hypothetical protein
MKKFVYLFRVFIVVCSVALCLTFSSCENCHWVRTCNHSIFDDCDDDCGYWECTPTVSPVEPTIPTPSVSVEIETEQRSGSRSYTSTFKIRVRNTGSGTAYDVKSKASITRPSIPSLGSMTPRVITNNHGTLQQSNSVSFSHSASENITVSGSGLYSCEVEVEFTDSQGKRYTVYGSAER